MEDSATVVAAQKSIPPSRGAERVPGLDAIRFVASLWVAIEHIGIPGTLTLQPAWLRGLTGILFSGGAAVAVFFVLSGFVIHYPHRDRERIALLPFYARRHIRILLPVVAVLALASLVGVTPAQMTHSVLWTLVCEEIYYTIYPLVHRIARRVGWPLIIGGALPASLLLAAYFQARGVDYHNYPWTVSWLVSWPLWLLGAWLAEHIDARPPAWTSDRAPWAWRLSVAGVGSVLMALHFHSPVGYGYTMKAFAFMVVAWMAREIAYARSGRRSPTLERLGAVSYSLYLVHYPILLWLGRGEFRTYVVVAVATVGFWWMVEAPAHRVARRFAGYVQRRFTPAQLPVVS